MMIFGGILYISFITDSQGNTYKHEAHPNRYKGAMRGLQLFKVFLVSSIVSMILYAVFPQKGEVLTMVALHAGDKYFEKNPNSALSPEKLIGTFDESAKELEKFVTTIPKILNKSLGIMDKSLSVADKKLDKISK
jgi:hypothetical protein